MPTASSSWFGKRRPSSIKTSAMRSAKDLRLIALRPAFEPVDGLQSFNDGARRGQIPRHRVIERLLHCVAPRRVERIAARDHDRAADQIEWNKQPAQRQI